MVGLILPAPMLLSEGRKPHPFGKPGWIWEIKFDGYRLIAGVHDGTVQLATRNGADATKWFPELTESLARLPGGPHIIDGEVCVLDSMGRSDFNALHARARRRRWYDGCEPVAYCAFDLLARDGRPLIGKPIEERKGQLQDVLAPGLPGVMFVGSFDAEHAYAMFDQAKALGLEGLVGKRLGSQYQPGVRTDDWIKAKVPGAVPPERFKR